MELPIENINKIKLNNKDWSYFAKLNEKLYNFSKNVFDYTENTKNKILDYVSKSIKQKFSQCEVNEIAFIKEDFTYLYKLIYNDNKSVVLAISLSPGNGFPNLVPSDELNVNVNIN